MLKPKPEHVEVITPDGEVIPAEQVMFAYTREGRRVIGKEYPNPIPNEAPLGFVEQKPLHEQIRDMVKNEMSRQAEAEGFETLEEADDFDVDDDFDPGTPFELPFEPDVPWPADPRVVAAEQAALAAKAAGGGGGAQPPSDKQIEPAPSAGDPPAPPEAPPAKQPKK